MKASCPRLFEVEALRDGRLSGTERTHFESHLAACAACAQEARVLQRISEALRAPSNPGKLDELHVRRERTRLLGAFDSRLVRAAREGRRPHWLLSAASVAVLSLLAVLALLLWVVPPAVVPRVAGDPSRQEPESVSIRADSSAKWSRRVEHRLETVVLESGALSIRVDHAASPRRLLVILPDGELEDIGTTFSVSAASGHTTRVTVQEGSVVLRLHGQAPLALGAGDSWTPPPPPPPPGVEDAVNEPLRAPSVRAVTAPMPPALARSAAATTPPDGSTQFRAALTAFNGGQHREAASLFSSFIAQNPGDGRAEDAAYLRVLALQRAGDVSAMQQAAADYLVRHPRGFRRSEVEPLSR